MIKTICKWQDILQCMLNPICEKDTYETVKKLGTWKVSVNPNALYSGGLYDPF